MRKPVEIYNVIKKSKKTDKIITETYSINDEITINKTTYTNILNIPKLDDFRIIKDGSIENVVYEINIPFKKKSQISSYEYISEDEYQELYTQYEEQQRLELENLEEPVE